MSPVRPALPFRVTLLLRAPGPVGDGDREEVLRVLRPEAGLPGPDAPPWTHAEAEPGTPDGTALHLHTYAPDGAAAGRAVIDAVRGRLGLDARFATWVVDARHVLVRDDLGGHVS